jgi:hypothetical protein
VTAPKPELSAVLLESLTVTQLMLTAAAGEAKRVKVASSARGMRFQRVSGMPDLVFPDRHGHRARAQASGSFVAGL